MDVKSFFEEQDYERFISRCFFYLYPCVETYAFCLLNNHFHCLIRVRTKVEQEQIFRFLKSTYSNDDFHGLEYAAFKFYRTSWQWGHLLNSHTKYINKKNDRTGALFEGKFRRKRITTNLYLSQLICYIHRNPVHHGITREYSDYTYSSYNILLDDIPTLLERRKVMEVFGDRNNYICAHAEFKDLLGNDYRLE